MTRVKLELPASFPFFAELTVQIGDINYGGHLGNDAVLRLAHEARIQYLKSIGYTELNIEGVGIIMTDAVVVFKSEAFHGDRLRIGVATANLQAGTFDFIYHITNSETGVEIARSKTGIAFFDYTARRVVPMPENFKAQVTRTHQS